MPSATLVIRFPSLRTTASPHGDRGRDGQLYVVDGDVRTALQYSVAADWRAKIRGTIARLEGTLSTVRELIYATSQLIGPDADDLKSELWREKNLILDICDRTWFVDRESTAPQRIAASEELIALKVKPILAERRIAESTGSVLDSGENRLALLHLSLDASDEAVAKGLTKASFESLILAALHGSNVDRPVGKGEILTRVRQMLPAATAQQVDALASSALTRLARKAGPIHRISKDDSYHVSFAEEKRLEARTAGFLVDERDLENQLINELEAAMGKPVEDGARSCVGSSLRVALEAILLRKGELFAAAAHSGAVVPITPDEIIGAIASDVVPDSVSPAQVAASATSVLERPNDGVRAHLRRLADAYTLFAFLRQTPDVQKVVVKIFADGDIWLDTSILLPLFAETLIDDPLNRPFTLTLRAAKEAGMHLYATDGVIEEVERHLNRSLAFSRIEVSKWRGRVPYIYAFYASSGRGRNSFGSWIEEFRGESRPEDDVREYLRDVLGIERRNLADLADRAPITVRSAVQEVWAEVHDRRRNRGADWDPGTISRLVAHDVENCVGVLEMRLRDTGGPMGFRHWWLTLDGAAFRLGSKLKAEFGIDAPMSPALSPDYLVQILRLGPMRTAVESELRVNLPLLIDFSRLDVTPTSLIESADTARDGMSETSEHVVRRRVRDQLDRMRSAYGSRVFERELVSR